MGANASTAVPVYVSGQVLDAARLNLTNAGIPVFSGTATRDAAFGASGQKVLAEGQFAYLEDTNAVQFYDSAAWQPIATAPALVLISTTTIGTTVSSVTVSNAFSATYDTYRIIVSGGAASATSNLQLTLGATATGYYAGIWDVGRTGATGATGQENTAFWLFGVGEPDGLSAIGDISLPFANDQTSFTSSSVALQVLSFGRTANGYLNNTTSYTAFTITASTGTFTGGTIRVYGYTKS